jgi:hypothetical protein
MTAIDFSLTSRQHLTGKAGEMRLFFTIIYNIRLQRLEILFHLTDRTKKMKHL